MPSKLGGLPQLSQDTPTLEPAPVVSADSAVAAFKNLADQASALAQPFIEQAATQAGDQAVTRDAQGNLTAKTIPVIGPSSEAYMHAAQLRYLSESQLDIRSQLADMQTKYDGNPEGFKAALDGAIAGKIGNAPSEFQPALRSMFESQGSPVYETL